MHPISLQWLGVFVAPMFLLGCATNGSESPPVLTLENKECVSAPDIASAKPLVLATNKPVTIKLDNTAPCFMATEGAKSIYSSFRLPQSASEYLVSVTSVPVGEGLFTPSLQLRDSSGAILRQLSRDAFVFHGSSLYAALRIHAGESYLIVVSDPASVGMKVSQIIDRTQANTAAGGGYYFTYNSGSEMVANFVYSLNGSIIVAAQPMPPVK